jgi:Repeat of unknown function (DUF346)/IPT/TIG domain
MTDRWTPIDGFHRGERRQAAERPQTSRSRRWALSAALALGFLAVAQTTAGAAPPPPTVASVTPNAGPNAGNSAITVAGTGFQSGAFIKINGANHASIPVGTTRLDTLTTAVPSVGSFVVEVDNPDGGKSTQPVVFNFYEPLPAGQLFSAAQPATHQIGGGTQLDIFGRGSDDKVYHTYRTSSHPSWNSWESLGGTVTSGLGAVSWGGQNRIDVFARGSDNALWHKWWDGTAWNGWEPLGGDLASGPAVTSWGVGRLDVFVRGNDNQLWRRHFDSGAWSGWEPLGGVLQSGPGGVSWGPNRIDVFVQGTDSAVWHKWWTGTQWSGWETLGGSIISAPAAASKSPGDLEVYAVGSASNLFHRPFTGSWTAWRGEGPYWAGPWGFGPGVVSMGGSTGVETFEVGNDHSTWHTVTGGVLRPAAKTAR